MDFFRRLSPPILAVFQRSICLRFFPGGFFGSSFLYWYVGGAYPEYFVCFLRGNAVRFFAARFSEPYPDLPFLAVCAFPCCLPLQKQGFLAKVWVLS